MSHGVVAKSIFQTTNEVGL